MMCEDLQFFGSVQRIVAHVQADSVSQEDLTQECLLRLWNLEREKPGQTRSWYLQNCRFHVQHCLAAGRSLDSQKRATGERRVSINGDDDELARNGYHTNGEILQSICARDLINALQKNLKPREQAVLGDLVDGYELTDICGRLKLSYPTVLKSRRLIAEATEKLGFSPKRPPSTRRTRRISDLPLARG